MSKQTAITTRSEPLQVKSSPASNTKSKFQFLSNSFGVGKDTNRFSQFTAPLIQTKLSIGAPNDKYEQEADRVADQVMRMPVSGAIHTQSPPQIQRMCSGCEEELQRQTIDEEEEEELIQTKSNSGSSPQLNSQSASGIQNIRGGGQPLNQSVRFFMESRFSKDFSQVRIHADSNASSLASSINARAFAYGHNIVFGAGEYQPETSAGRRLLAHELTHVVQQTGRENGFLQTQPIIQRYFIPPAFLEYANYLTLGEKDAEKDKELLQQIEDMADTPPIPAGGKQPKEADKAYKKAKSDAEAAVPSGTKFTWDGVENEITDFKISAVTKVRSVEQMVDNYFGGKNAGYIVGYLMEKVGAKVNPSCGKNFDSSTVPNITESDNLGLTEKFFKIRNQSSWTKTGAKFGSSGAASFPGTSRHAGRGAYDLKFKVTYKKPDGTSETNKKWGKAGNNSKVRATSWWKLVNTQFEKNNFDNLSSEYWHFDYEGKMSPPEKTLDVDPLQKSIKKIAILANAVEYNFIDYFRRCLKNEVKKNYASLPSVGFLRQEVQNARSLSLATIDNSTENEEENGEAG